MSFCSILDTETTGLVNPEVIEFACAEVTTEPDVRPIVFKMGALLAERYKPVNQISLGAMSTHHIIPEDLDDFPSAPKTWGLSKYIIGHSVDFDWAALGSPEGTLRICTLALARDIWSDLDSHKLAALIYHLFPHREAREMVRGAHNADVDIRLCFEVFKALMKERATEAVSWAAIWRMSEEARVPKKMAFGKHQGLAIKDVPKDYVEWYRRQPKEKQDPYLIKAFDMVSQ